MREREYGMFNYQDSGEKQTDFMVNNTKEYSNLENAVTLTELINIDNTLLTRQNIIVGASGLSTSNQENSFSHVVWKHLARVAS